MTRTAWGLDTDTGEHWSVRGACRTGDPDGWSEVRNTGSAIALGNKRAILACRRCPVVEACRAFGEQLAPFDRRSQVIGGTVYDSRGRANEDEQVHVWLTNPSIEERERLRRERVSVGPPAQCGTPAGYGRHRRHGEEPCEPCRSANTAKCAEYRERRAEAC
jgi:hypothetical protein